MRRVVKTHRKHQHGIDQRRHERGGKVAPARIAGQQDGRRGKERERHDHRLADAQQQRRRRAVMSENSEQKTPRREGSPGETRGMIACRSTAADAVVAPLHSTVAKRDCALSTRGRMDRITILADGETPAPQGSYAQSSITRRTEPITRAQPNRLSARMTSHHQRQGAASSAAAAAEGIRGSAAKGDLLLTRARF